MIENITTGSTMLNYGFLPDNVPVSNLMERIAADKKWSKEDIENDIAILSKNRIVYVHDLRALSRESWTQIELLPLVKDLLRSAVDPDWCTNEKSGYIYNTLNNSSSQNNGTTTATTTIFEEAKKLKKNKKAKSLLLLDEGFLFGSTAAATAAVDNKEKKKKNKNKEEKKNKDKKKDKKKKLGSPVKPFIFNHDALTTSSQLNNNDTTTIQNTIRNGSLNSPFMPNAIHTLSLSSSSSSSSSTSSSICNSDDDEIKSLPRRKSVTFSKDTAIGIAASLKSSAAMEDDDDEEEEEEEEKKKEKNSMASSSSNSNGSGGGGYNNNSINFTSHHPYTTHPIVKFRKMKMKHCKKLPEVPPNDSFLQGIHDKLLLSQQTDQQQQQQETSSFMDTSEK